MVLVHILYLIVFQFIKTLCTTGYGAVINTLKIEKGATVAVIGLGGVGLASVMGAVKVGASKIIGVDINPDKFPKAIEFGCTDVINPLEHKDKELPELIFDLTDGVGVDYSIEWVGSTHIMKQAFLSTKPNGGASCAIGVTPFEHNIELQSEDVCGREWTGWVFGDAKSLDMIPQYVDEYMNCEIKLDEFITHNFDLQDINQAFHELHSGKWIKSITTFITNWKYSFITFFKN